MEECPKCKKKLEHFSGNEGIPDGYYCPDCNDYIYDETGKIIVFLD